jgi:hypothetical protein
MEIEVGTPSCVGLQYLSQSKRKPTLTGELRARQRLVLLQTALPLVCHFMDMGVCQIMLGWVYRVWQRVGFGIPSVYHPTFCSYNYMRRVLNDLERYPDFLAVVWYHCYGSSHNPPPPPTAVSKLSIFLSLPVCHCSSSMEGELGEGDGGCRQIIRWRESLVL